MANRLKAMITAILLGMTPVLLLCSSQSKMTGSEDLKVYFFDYTVNSFTITTENNGEEVSEWYDTMIMRIYFPEEWKDTRIEIIIDREFPRDRILTQKTYFRLTLTHEQLESEMLYFSELDFEYDYFENDDSAF